MKQSVAIVFVLLGALLAFSGCSAGKEELPENSMPQPIRLDLTFTLILPSVPTEEWTQVQRGAQDACQALGIELEVFMPSVAFDTNQLDVLLLSAVDSGSDGILTYPSSSITALDAAKNCAIPYAFIGSTVPDGGQIASVQVSPQTCGKVMAKALADASSQELCLVAGNFSPDTFDFLALSSFEETLVSEGCSQTLQSIDSRDPQQAKEFYIDLLAKKQGVGAAINFSSFGAAEAARAVEETSSPDILILGFGDDDATLEGIQNGTIDATLCPNYHQMGYSAVDALYRHHAGTLTQPEELEVSLIWVTQDNVSTYRDEMASLSNVQQSASA